MIDVSEIHDLMRTALDKYTVVCGLDENNWSSRGEIEMLNLASELDDTGITMFAMLRGLYDLFLKDTKFSAKYVMDEFKKFSTTITAIRELYDIVEDSQIMKHLQMFESGILRSALGYGKLGDEMPALKALLDDKYDMASVRLSALRSARDLQRFQFLQGESSKEPLKVNHWIFEFWNINSLVAAMRAQRIPGVSLCLIRDPDQVMASYFVFAVANGENLTILTDREEGPHPMYWKMARRPDRDMARRWQKNYFPYHLLNLKPIEDEYGNLKGYSEAERTGLVKYNLEAIKLSPLGSLPPADFMWTTLLLDRINEEFGKKQTLLPTLAYTGEMIVTPEALVGSTGTLVQQKLYRPLQLPKLHSEDVTRKTTAEQWEHDPTTFNDWAEKRYAKNVPTELLNIVGEQQRHLLAASANLVRDDGWNKKEVQLVGFSPVTFGDAEKLHRDQLWVARYNQMQHVNQQMHDEYKANKAEVIEWWSTAIKRRKEQLVEAALRMEFAAKSVRYPSWGFEPDIKEINILKIGLKSHFLDSNTARLSEWGRSFGNWACYLQLQEDDTLLKANVYALFTPDNPMALAELAGVEVAELPVWLQHWYQNEPYDGNCILDRLDPLDWVVNNPWHNLRFLVHIPFAKSNFHRARKALGLPFHRFPNENDV